VPHGWIKLLGTVCRQAFHKLFLIVRRFPEEKLIGGLAVIQAASVNAVTEAV
jgi:hypothetical protein